MHHGTCVTHVPCCIPGSLTSGFLWSRWRGKRPPALELPVWLGKSLHETKISRVTCDRFTIVPNDIRGYRVIYDRPAKTCDQRRIQLRIRSLANEIDNFHDRFLTVKRDRGACRFQWRVSSSYCENSGVTYDLLVSNIGGTYELADQLPSNPSLVIFWS